MCRRQTPGREREREGGREREGEREGEGGGVREASVGVILPTMHTCMHTHKYCTLGKDENE